MTTEHHIITVTVENVLTEHGHWCSSCKLPSGWLVIVAVAHQARMHLQARTWCDECDQQDTIAVEWLPT